MIELGTPKPKFKVRFAYRESENSPLVVKEEEVTEEQYQEMIDIKTEVTPCPKFQTQD